MSEEVPMLNAQLLTTDFFLGHWNLVIEYPAHAAVSISLDIGHWTLATGRIIGHYQPGVPLPSLLLDRRRPLPLKRPLPESLRLLRALPQQLLHPPLILERHPRLVLRP